MKTLKLFLIALILSSCATTNKTKLTKTTIDELRKKNQLYGINNNSYFYFMIDSLGNKHLVRTHMFNSSKVIWTEKLIKR